MATFNYHPSTRPQTRISLQPRQHHSAGCCGGGSSYYDDPPTVNPTPQPSLFIPPPCTTTSITTNSPLMTLITMQQTEGYWHFDALPPELTQFKTVLREFSESFREKTEVLWATLLVVVYLKVKYGENEAEWRLIARKATKWMRNYGVCIEEWEEKMRLMLKDCISSS